MSRLAILKTNGDEILKVKDDGELMNILKGYFADLGSLIPNPEANSTTKQMTRFNELMMVAYREFHVVTHETVLELRKSHQLKVILGLDTYAKKSLVRNLTLKVRLNKDNMFFLCDQFFTVLYYYGDLIERTASETSFVDLGSSKRMSVSSVTGANAKHDKLDFGQFSMYMERITTWGAPGKDRHEYRDILNVSIVEVCIALIYYLGRWETNCGDPIHPQTL
jgi:hypothetical protein